MGEYLLPIFSSHLPFVVADSNVICNGSTFRQIFYLSRQSVSNINKISKRASGNAFLDVVTANGTDVGTIRGGGLEAEG